MNKVVEYFMTVYCKHCIVSDYARGQCICSRGPHHISGVKADTITQISVYYSIVVHSCRHLCVISLLECFSSLLPTHGLFHSTLKFHSLSFGSPIVRHPVEARFLFWPC